MPQGSILGPILFLIYINDITSSSNKLNFVLYADDTNIFLQGKDLNELKSTLNEELKKVSDWIKSNKLMLNTSKTHFMLSHSLNQTNDIEIKINNNKINEVKDTKFLGIILDNKLNWQPQCNEIKIKISKISGLIYRVRNFINSDCLRQIYLSIAYPYMTYCSSIWGGSCKTYLDEVTVAQKKLIRIMFHKQRYAHTNPLFDKYKLLKFQDIVSTQTCLFVHKALHNYPVNNYFIYLSHNTDTRRPRDLRLPLCRTTHAQQNILFRGAKLWNQLPEEIKNILTLNSFKHKSKLKIFEKYQQL